MIIEKGVGVYPTGGCLFMKTGEKTVEWLRGVEIAQEDLGEEMDDEIVFLDEYRKMENGGSPTLI